MSFAAYAAQPDEGLDWLTGALFIAKDAHPSLEFDRYVRRLDDLAASLYRARLHRLPLRQQAQALSEHLYDRHGFRGNHKNYYDPRNSFINDVLDRKLGIPITLALVYTEIARRVGVEARGVGFPGHFLVRLDGPEHSDEREQGETIVVDPFAGGAVLEQSVLEQMVERLRGAPQSFDPSWIAPATVRSILIRMLANLRAIYGTRGDHARSLVVLDRIVDLSADGAREEIRDRGLLWAKLGAPAAALDDLRTYLRLAPASGDVAQVRRLIGELEQAGGLGAN